MLLHIAFECIAIILYILGKSSKFGFRLYITGYKGSSCFCSNYFEGNACCTTQNQLKTLFIFVCGVSSLSNMMQINKATELPSLAS